jgi:hypothetical protein
MTEDPLPPPPPQVDFYNCVNCLGGLQPGPGNPAFLYGWQCTGGC